MAARDGEQVEAGEWKSVNLKKISNEALVSFVANMLA